MEVKVPDAMWLDPQHGVDQSELARICALSEAEIDELVARGVLAPLANQPDRLFHAAVVPPLREAARLRSGFGLDLLTMGLLLRYLQRIVDLEHRLRALQAPQAQYTHHVHLEREGPAPWREPHA